MDSEAFPDTPVYQPVKSRNPVPTQLQYHLPQSHGVQLVLKSLVNDVQTLSDVQEDRHQTILTASRHANDRLEAMEALMEKTHTQLQSSAQPQPRERHPDIPRNDSQRQQRDASHRRRSLTTAVKQLNQRMVKIESFLSDTQTDTKLSAANPAPASDDSDMDSFIKNLLP
jgi:hypothetical protein